jgi:hypothetical protein
MIPMIIPEIAEAGVAILASASTGLASVSLIRKFLGRTRRQNFHGPIPVKQGVTRAKELEKVVETLRALAADSERDQQLALSAKKVAEHLLAVESAKLGTKPDAGTPSA